MAPRWITYDDAYSRIEAAVRKAGGEIAETEDFIVSMLAQGQLKARAQELAVYDGRKPVRLETNYDIHPSFWTQWIAKPQDRRNGGPDFSWWGIGKSSDASQRLIRQVSSGTMIERNGLEAVLSAISLPKPSLAGSAAQLNETERPDGIDWVAIEISFSARADEMGRDAFARLTYTDAGKLVADLINPKKRTSYTDRWAGEFRGRRRAKWGLPKGRGI